MLMGLLIHRDGLRLGEMLSASSLWKIQFHTALLFIAKFLLEIYLNLLFKYYKHDVYCTGYSVGFCLFSFFSFK